MHRVGLAGAGRMGKAIAEIILADPELELAAVWTRDPGGIPDDTFPESAAVTRDPATLIASSDVIIDFSLPEGTQALLAAMADSPLPLVCGVSGLGDGEMKALNEASTKAPVVYDRNMSAGVAVLTRIVEETAAALGSEFAVRIDETHHIHKKDAPSGTALKLGEAVASGRGAEPSVAMAVGEDPTGVAADRIAFQVTREGEVPGDHTVHFRTPSETVSLSHSVTTRDVFARGAVRAARWIVDRPAALYDMSAVLFSGPATK